MPAKNLKTAIASSEMDVRSFQDASGETIPEGNRRMGLTDMCPNKLQEHLRACGKDRFKSYEHIKCEIVDWLMNEARKGKIGGRAAALGEKESEAQLKKELSRWTGTWIFAPLMKKVCPAASSWPL